MDAVPWSQRPATEHAISRADAHAAATALSRLEARLLLEATVESRFPRWLARKPCVGGWPLDLYDLHQGILRFGGYRHVSKTLRLPEEPPLLRRTRARQWRLRAPRARGGPPAPAAGAGTQHARVWCRARPLSLPACRGIILCKPVPAGTQSRCLLIYPSPSCLHPSPSREGRDPQPVGPRHRAYRARPHRQPRAGA
jgi:hypothetical protein